MDSDLVVGIVIGIVTSLVAAYLKDRLLDKAMGRFSAAWSTRTERKRREREAKVAAIERGFYTNAPSWLVWVPLGFDGNCGIGIRTVVCRIVVLLQDRRYALDGGRSQLAAQESRDGASGADLCRSQSRADASEVTATQWSQNYFVPFAGNA